MCGPGTFIINFRSFQEQHWKSDFGILGCAENDLLGHFKNLKFPTTFWISDFSIFFCYFELYLDRTIHICSYVELYMDRTIHICSYVDVAGGRGGSPGGRRAVAPGAGNQFRLPP